MNQKKRNSTRRAALLAALVMVAAGLSGYAANAGNAYAASSAAQADAAAAKPSAQAKVEDLDAAWEEAKATLITLSGADIAISGNGAAANGAVVTISSAGTYVVSGTLSDGQIQIAATKDDIVRLVLNGADITNQKGAPIYASQCDKLIVTLADGTTNALTDGGDAYQYADSTQEEPNATLFCKDDLTVNGSGSLTVNAGFKNGIGTKDDLLIVSGAFTVKAANHGLRGNDSVTVLGGSFHITAGNDGIQTNNAEDAGKGFIAIEDGVFSILAAHDGMQADQTVDIYGGEFTITAGGGASAAAAASPDTASDSFKGIKTAGSIQITGGRFTVDSYDDSVHANGSILISGGDFTLRTGDDAVHADGDLTIRGGSIAVSQSYEGLEANTIAISGGTIDLISSDDGINAAGGSDGQTDGGWFGRDSFALGNCSITISGGQITIFAKGDGLDANGPVAISGGNIVSIIESRANGAMDCDGRYTLTGGTVIWGGTEVGYTPDEGSTQSYVCLTGVSAGSEITVQKDGKTLISFTPAAACQALALSSLDIASGESYEVYGGATLLATATAGAGGGQMGGMGAGGGMGGTPPGGMGGWGGTPPAGSDGMPPDGMQPGRTRPDGKRDGN